MVVEVETARRERAVPALDVRGIVKQFGSNRVLRGVDLRIGQGEFVGLMGPNGAGKSTLLKILDGVYSPTSGTIELFGRPVSSLASTPEVGFIHQDLGLVEAMTVLENIRLGERPLTRFGLLDRAAEAAQAREALDSVGLDTPLHAQVAQLSPGEKTLVAVARSFSRGATLLFVDEATSTLPPRDAQRVIAALSRVTAEGRTVVMISHKLSEVLDATNRVVVLLDGAIASDRPTSGLDRQDLIDMLLQHEIEATAMPPADRTVGELVISMHQVRGGKAGPIDLAVHAGEIVGITGLPGSGLHDIGHLAFGSLKPTGGTVTLRDGGVRRSFVPPHRESQGGFDDLPVRENMSASSMRRWRHPFRLLALARERAATDQLGDRLSVRPRGVETKYGTLSGGNKQKAVIGRGLLNEAELMVLCEPTRGVDIGTRSDIYELMRELSRAGVAILMVTSDAEDLFAVAHRVGVVVDGVVDGLRATGSMSQDELKQMI